jgi:hypothetical protein
MNRRNFKVRLKNINLKETFSLEHSPSEHDIYAKYDKLLNKQGFSLVTHETNGKTKTYSYYPINLEEKRRKEVRAKNRTKTGKPRRSSRLLRPGRIGPRRPRVDWRKPEFMVTLEITMLHETPKYRI